MQKYYSKLIDIDGRHDTGLFSKGRWWQIHLEPNPSCGTVYSPNQDPANEIIIYAHSENRAQYIANMIMAAHCLYTGQVFTTDVIKVFRKRAQTADEIAEQLLAGGRGYFGASNLPVSCLITSKASQRLAYQYAIFKYQLSCHTVLFNPLDLDPDGDWRPGRAVSPLPEDHVYFAYAIITSYSVLEELSIEIRASEQRPSKLNGRWNPSVKEDLNQRLVKAGIDPSEHIVWNLRDTPTNIERVRQPILVQKAEWAYSKVRDGYIDLFEAIAYASWLRSRVSAHRLMEISRSLTIYDVANVQHLARHCLLQALGFWRYYERHICQSDDTKQPPD